MNTVLLSIGSNTFARTNIDKAKRMLSRTFPNIVFTNEAMSLACGVKALMPFRNILAKFNCDLTPTEIISKLKTIEAAVGRSPRDKYLKRVVMDIDLLVYGEEVIRPKDFSREYVQNLLNCFSDTSSPEWLNGNNGTSNGSSSNTPAEGLNSTPANGYYEKQIDSCNGVSRD